MTQDIIIEGNRLIAEFMDFGNTDGNLARKINPKGFRKYASEKDLLSYHRNWEWLMPVVEKIEKDRNCIIIDGTSCHIDSNDGQYSETNCCTMNNRFETDKDTESKIESTWIAVVEFINWYNKNKKS